MTSKTSSALRVESLPGEGFLRFHVESRSTPDQPNMVDLGWRNGWGRCSCTHWNCDIWPKIRDRTPESNLQPMTRESTCLHVRLAFTYWARQMLPLWIDMQGQSQPEEG